MYLKDFVQTYGTVRVYLVLLLLSVLLQESIFVLANILTMAWLGQPDQSQRTKPHGFCAVPLVSRNNQLCIIVMWYILSFFRCKHGLLLCKARTW